MGKHEYRGVRAQRAMNLAAARREEKEKMKRMKYGYYDPSRPEFYPRSLARPTTPRPQSAGLAMRGTEARDIGIDLGPAPEKPKETVRSTSWKYLHTCVGIMALAMVGIGLLVGITSHWVTSRAGQAGIGLICGGVGLVIGVIIFAFIRLKHAKMKEKRREKKKAKTDLEAGKSGGKAIQTKGTAQDLPMRPMSSKPNRPTKSRNETKEEREETSSYEESGSEVNEETTSDTANIVPRSVSRTSMSLQGSINMSAIPEDEEEEEQENDNKASSSKKTSESKDLDSNSLPGVIVTSEKDT
nr:uncharacterized protein LOC129269959 [Lytechinus pictus]